jgi:hypothetical protein
MHSLPKALQFSDHLIHLPPSIMEKSSSLFSNPNPNPTSTQLRQEFQHEEFIMSNDGIAENNWENNSSTLVQKPSRITMAI